MLCPNFWFMYKKYKNLSKNLFELSILFSPQDVFSWRYWTLKQYSLIWSNIKYLLVNIRLSQNIFFFLSKLRVDIPRVCTFANVQIEKTLPGIFSNKKEANNRSSHSWILFFFFLVSNANILHQFGLKAIRFMVISGGIEVD